MTTLTRSRGVPLVGRIVRQSPADLSVQDSDENIVIRRRTALRLLRPSDILSCMRKLAAVRTSSSTSAAKIHVIGNCVWAMIWSRAMFWAATVDVGDVSHLPQLADYRLHHCPLPARFSDVLDSIAKVVASKMGFIVGGVGLAVVLRWHRSLLIVLRPCNRFERICEAY